jgi:hypothetical protein
VLTLQLPQRQPQRQWLTLAQTLQLPTSSRRHLPAASSKRPRQLLPRTAAAPAGMMDSCQQTALRALGPAMFFSWVSWDLDTISIPAQQQLQQRHQNVMRRRQQPLSPLLPPRSPSSPTWQQAAAGTPPPYSCQLLLPLQRLLRPQRTLPGRGTTGAKPCNTWSERCHCSLGAAWRCWRGERRAKCALRCGRGWGSMWGAPPGRWSGEGAPQLRILTSKESTTATCW